jgi:hypothetical protein
MAGIKPRVFSMKRWVPSPEASHTLSLLGFVATLALGALCFVVHTGAMRVPLESVFVVVPLVFVFFYPATSLIARRAESMGQFRLSPDLWRVLFAGTPLPVALFAIAYFYAMIGWLYLSDVIHDARSGAIETLGQEAAFLSFFSAIASAMIVIASAILFGHRPKPLASPEL